MRRSERTGAGLVDGTPSLRPAFAGEPRAGDDQPGDSPDEAYARGVVAGREEERAAAREACQREIEDVRGAVDAALGDLATLHDRIAHASRDALVEVALEAASCMLRARIDAGDAVASRALEQALEALPPGPGLVVRANPADRAALESTLHEVGATAIDLIDDPAVTRGGLIVEAEHGGVDATVETAEAVLRRASSDGNANP